MDRKVVAIVQARMGSTRLPGKVLKDILGKPMLWHLVKRVRAARYVDDVVIAATTNEKDDSLEKFAVENNLGIYRGSEDDIVDRLFNAGGEYDAHTIVRVWGDCPLIDPDLIDKVLSEFISGGYDYANNFNPPTYPVCMSFEVYTLKTLERIWNETDDMFYRQYPSEYIYRNHVLFKTIYDKNDINLSNIHLTVDYIQDFELITEIFRALYKDDRVFHIKDILEFIGKYPKLKEMNKDLARNIEFNRDKILRGES